jgi:hypothetical protein
MSVKLLLNLCDLVHSKILNYSLTIISHPLSKRVRKVVTKIAKKIASINLIIILDGLKKIKIRKPIGKLKVSISRNIDNLSRKLSIKTIKIAAKMTLNLSLPKNKYKNNNIGVVSIKK